VDFKTDNVTEENVEERAVQYRPQVLAYADAMARIYQKPVKEVFLYFFHLGKFVSV
jgi:ATP-dependent helicase/nuclease subunit A